MSFSLVLVGLKNNFIVDWGRWDGFIAQRPSHEETDEPCQKKNMFALTSSFQKSWGLDVPWHWADGGCPGISSIEAYHEPGTTMPLSQLLHGNLAANRQNPLVKTERSCGLSFGRWPWMPSIVFKPEKIGTHRCYLLGMMLHVPPFTLLPQVLGNGGGKLDLGCSKIKVSSPC